MTAFLESPKNGQKWTKKLVEFPTDRNPSARFGAMMASHDKENSGAIGTVAAPASMIQGGAPCESTDAVKEILKALSQHQRPCKWPPRAAARPRRRASAHRAAKSPASRLRRLSSATMAEHPEVNRACRRPTRKSGCRLRGEPAPPFAALRKPIRQEERRKARFGVESLSLVVHRAVVPLTPLRPGLLCTLEFRCHRP